MSALTANLMQEDFPVGFAEQKENHHQIDDNTVFYVEWLDDNAEFPGLSGNTNQNNFTFGNWELLQRKEVNEDEHTLVPVEGDAWSKLTTPETNELYANVTEKNASELQPTKRVIQSLWSNINNKKNNSKKEENDEINEDTYQDDLAYDLVDIHKSQSRRANRLSAKRQMHDLKTVDIHVEGILRVATSNTGKTAVTWVPYEKKLPTIENNRKKNILDTYVDNLANVRVTNKAQALTFSAKFTHNVKRYSYKYSTAAFEQPKRPSFPDSGEFSVHSAIVRQ